MLKLLAFDYGASSGRAIGGLYDGDTIKIEEIHRFSNDPVSVNGTLYWDILRLFFEMKQGILKAVKIYGQDIDSIGIDTWGVDFGLLDKKGDLIGNTVHYRDLRTQNMIEEASAKVPKEEIFNTTGIAFQKFNTLYQLLAVKKNQPHLLQNAKTLLFMPDLLGYFLTGEMHCEYSIASTSQMLDARAGTWAFEMLGKLDLPADILRPVVNAGTKLGQTSNAINDELNLKGITVISVAGHDTASAVMAVPASKGRYGYLSSGTWSLLGVELDQPVINEKTYTLNYTNEGGFNNTTRLLKNIMGLWIYQECRRSWEKEGTPVTFDELENAAGAAEPFKCFIDPDDDIFYSPGKMPQKVVDFCRDTGQRLPESRAEIVRCIMESLALKYRYTLDGLEDILGWQIPQLNIVGGGSQNKMLSRFAANACNKTVITGPIEATAIGNLLCQLISAGELKDIYEARELVKRSFPVHEYMPCDKDLWDEAYSRFIKILKMKG